MGETDVVNSRGHFVWYELITTDKDAAMTFYTKVMGWGAWDASTPGRTYILFTDGNTSVSGLMNMPDDARNEGSIPYWLGYVGVNDVDAAAERVRRLGGALLVPPTEVPGVVEDVEPAKKKPPQSSFADMKRFWWSRTSPSFASSSS